MGPGGLTRREQVLVRDVHYTHYEGYVLLKLQRVPILDYISLAMFAEVNDHGFIESPYREVVKENGNSKVTNNIKFLSADDEDRVMVAQANTEMDDLKNIIEKNIRTRVKGDFPIVGPESVDYVEVSPTQILSVAAALIPFLEHDDANRALMGSNMQRQAVPLMYPKAPIVGTGIEKGRKDSRSCVVSPVEGKIVYVDSNTIHIKRKDVQDSLTLFEGEAVHEIELKNILEQIKIQFITSDL